MDPKAPTLDQIAVFLAIVETGSFAAAARKLGRATSVISYAIANLEAQLGVTPVRPRRHPHAATDRGRPAILSDSRSLAFALDGLLAKARGLTARAGSGGGAVGGCDVPAKKLVKALDEFQQTLSHRDLAPAGRSAGRGDRRCDGTAGGVRRVAARWTWPTIF